MALENDDIQVDCLHKAGRNRFFQPRLKDITWYTDDKVIAIISEPQLANRRHVMIEKVIVKSV